MQGVLKVAQGSSPRVRGTPARYRRRSSRPGIIPACAGNTSPGVGSPLHDRDHPRVCGEHLRFNGIRCLGKGSSPRVRGTRLWWFSCSVLLGIIPACAGNTNRLAVRRPAWRDHPRVCGEHALLMILSTGSAGSSPRVRGTRTHETYSRWEVGIIPACAGNTKRTRPWPAEAGIIPACAGNTGSSLVRWVRSSGSSPRVRGTLPRPVHRADHEGIIPACAGNTIWLRPSRRGSGNHPRVCGEH